MINLEPDQTPPPHLVWSVRTSFLHTDTLAHWETTWHCVEPGWRKAKAMFPFAINGDREEGETREAAQGRQGRVGGEVWTRK